MAHGKPLQDKLTVPPVSQSEGVKSTFDPCEFMSRPLRTEYPDAWEHVMNRGRRREDVFSAEGDYDARSQAHPILALSTRPQLYMRNVKGYLNLCQRI
jgi:hypothetical protein